MLTSEQRAAYVKAEMQDYSDGCYADHGSAKDQINRFAQTIESAATAPLLARIAELEAANEAFGKRQEWWNARMLELEQQLAEARKDAELLDWMIFYSARLSHSNDAECCQVIWVNEDGEQRTKPFGNAREAIRAAIKEQT